MIFDFFISRGIGLGNKMSGSDTDLLIRIVGLFERNKIGKTVSDFLDFERDQLVANLTAAELNVQSHNIFRIQTPCILHRISF